MIRFNIFPTFILISLVFLSGCFDNKNPKSEKQINDLNQKIIADEKRIASIEKKDQDFHEFINQQLKATFQELQYILKRVERYDKIVLHPSEKGFQRINTSNGFFLISLEDVKPYLNAYKLFFEIGNPSSAIYKRFTLNVR